MPNKTSKLKVMTILGTRPEIIRLSRILPRMDQAFHHIIVYTKQSYDYELSDVFFSELELRKPDYVLDVKSDTLGGQIGNIFQQTEKVLQKEMPDALLILGDTNSALSAVLAKRMKILVFHMEAGNRSFDWNVPEEVNRRIVDHVSDYNLCYTEHARRYLLAEGLDPQKVFVTGSPLTEVFMHFSKKIESSAVLEELDLSPKKYFLVSCHREENVDNKESLQELFSSFDYLAKVYNLPIVVSMHPRTKKRVEEFGIKISNGVKIHKPFGHFAYNKLQKSALCVLSDSGSIQEESAIFDFPAVQIRVSTERPEAFDAGSIVLTGFNHDAIVNAVNLVIEQEKRGEKSTTLPDYKDTNISTKVVKLVMGLTSLRKYHNRKL